MGNCVSSNSRVNSRAEIPSPTDQRSELKELDGEEFEALTLTIKEVLIVLLRRLCTTLGFENEAFHQLALHVRRTHYFDFVPAQQLDDFFHLVFDIAEVTADPDVDPNDMQFPQRKFELLLDEVDEAPYKKPVFAPHKERLESLQRAAQEIREGLEEASKFCDAQGAFKQLKDHLILFARAFEVFDGDLFHQPQLFYANIDRCVGS